MQIPRPRKFVLGDRLGPHPWSQLSGLSLKAFRSEMELSDPWRAGAPSPRGAGSPAAERATQSGGFAAGGGDPGGDSSPFLRGAGRGGKRGDFAVSSNPCAERKAST